MKTTKGTSPTTGQAFEITETENTNSVEITINAKGEAQVAVKVYDDRAEGARVEAQTVLLALLASLRFSGLRIAGDPKKEDVR